MKKFMLFAASLAVFGFVFAACGSKKATEVPVAAEVVEEEVIEMSTTTAESPESSVPDEK